MTISPAIFMVLGLDVIVSVTMIGLAVAIKKNLI